MKQYFQPNIQVVKIDTVHVIAASGDNRNVTIYNETIENTTFNSREFDYEEED